MTTLESVLNSRELAVNSLFCHMVMFPRDLDSDTAEEIGNWLETNCKGRFSVRSIRNAYSFRFADTDDFMLFSLRWL